MTITSLFLFVTIIYAVFAVLLSALLVIIGNYYRKEGIVIGFQLCRVSAYLLFIPLLILGLCWIDAQFIDPNWIQVSKITVKSKIFPKEINKIRIVQFSDLHIVEKIGEREKSLIRKVNKLKPDLIFITGDFVTSRQGLGPCLEVLAQLKAAKGIYAVLGNHDYYYFQEKEIVEALKKVNVTVLKHDNLKVELNRSLAFWLVGISHRYAVSAKGEKDKYITEAFSGVSENDPKLVLLHSPDTIEAESLQKMRPQLVLAGHTHGGQFGIAALRKFSWYAERSNYMAGMFRVNQIPLYVNRGIGMVTKDLWFLCRPEITLIRLKKI